MISPEILSTSLNAAIKAGQAILDVYTSPFAIEYKEDKSPLTLADKNANEIILENLKLSGIPVLSEEGKKIPYEERRTWRELWVVDPLDGTKEFIKRNGEFTVNIALVRDGLSVFGVIYQPVPDLLYYGNIETGAFKVTGAGSISQSDYLKKSIALNSHALPARFTVVASRSHPSPETTEFIENARRTHGDVDLISSGSSLKLCMIAEGKAHVYPRFAPTMEWDTAAGHAIVKSAGRNIYSCLTGAELRYNKPDLLNDWFIAK